MEALIILIIIGALALGTDFILEALNLHDDHQEKP